MLEAALSEVVDAVVARRVAPLEARIAELTRAINERLPEAWMTRRQAADRLGVAMDTIDRRIAARDPSIEVQRVGRAVRVRLVQQTSAAELAMLAAEARR